jgi:hypothetical protein
MKTGDSSSQSAADISAVSSSNLEDVTKSNENPAAAAFRASLRLLILYFCASVTTWPLMMQGPNALRQSPKDLEDTLSFGPLILSGFWAPLSMLSLILLLMSIKRGRPGPTILTLNRIAYFWYVPLGLVLGIACGYWSYYHHGAPQL